MSAMTAQTSIQKAEIGRFFEDYEVGVTYQHPFGRTINEADSTWFTLLTCNTNQNHFNVDLAKSNPITGGRVIVNSGLTLTLAQFLATDSISSVTGLGRLTIEGHIPKK